MPQQLEGHEYPFHLAHEEENFCEHCNLDFYAKYVDQPVLIETNEVVRRDVIKYKTECPHCGKETVAYFTYYYD